MSYQVQYNGSRRLTRRPKTAKYIINNYIILDGLEGDTRIYCQRC